MFFHDIKYLRKTKMKNWLIIRTFKQLTVDCHILKEYDSISGLKDVNVRIFINIIYAFRWLVLFIFSLHWHSNQFHLTASAIFETGTALVEIDVVYENGNQRN